VHDPMIVGFDSVPACDRQADTRRMRMSRSSIAECDKYEANVLGASFMYISMTRCYLSLHAVVHSHFTRMSIDG